jgi:hypothetical protein
MILTWRFYNKYIDESRSASEQKRNKYKNWSRMDHKSNYFLTSTIIEKSQKMKT